MPDLTNLPALAIGLTFFIAGMVKGITGMGLPTIAMGMLGTLMPPAGAAALLILPSFVTNVWQLMAGPNLAGLVYRFWTMLLGICIGTLGAAGLMTVDRSGWAASALGGALVLYAIWGLLAPVLLVPARIERRLSPAIGVVTGLITGVTGVFVIPAVPYLQALAMDRQDLMQALGLSFTVSTIALAVGLRWHGALPIGDLVGSGAAVVPALLGMWLGQRLGARVSAAMFKKGFFLCLLMLGLQLLLKRFF